MSSRELEREAVMGRVKSGTLKLKHVAALLKFALSPDEESVVTISGRRGQGLEHLNAGKPSNRSKLKKLHRRVLSLIEEKYSGEEGEGLGRP